MSLAKRVRRLSQGYQGMDDQEAIAREVEALSAQNSLLASTLKVVRSHVEQLLNFQEYAPSDARVNQRNRILWKAYEALLAQTTPLSAKKVEP